MATKFTSLATLTGAYANVAALNANFALIAEEFDKIQYLSGLAPNAWTGNYDANGKRLLNLSDGGTNQEPATIAQLNAAVLSTGGMILAETPFTIGGVMVGKTVGLMKSAANLIWDETSDAENLKLVGNSVTSYLKNWTAGVEWTCSGTPANINMDITPKGAGKITAKQFGQTGELCTTANVATTYAIDLSKGNIFDLTMTAATTFTFTNPLSSGWGSNFTLILRQDATGGWAATLPTIKWNQGTPPTLTTAASGFDVFTFLTVDGGTTWLGFTGGLTMA